MSATQTTQTRRNEPRQRGGEPRPLADILAEVYEDVKARRKKKGGAMPRETAMFSAESRDFETPETRELDDRTKGDLRPVETPGQATALLDHETAGNSR